MNLHDPDPGTRQAAPASLAIPAAIASGAGEWLALPATGGKADADFGADGFADRLALPAAWLAWFLFYLRSSCPSLGGEDSGEFATAAATLGITHSPGYPLYVLLGRLFVFLPLGSPAFRVNLLSASGAALAVAVLFSLVRREALRVGAGKGAALGAALVAALVAGLGRALWFQAGISDKYPLNLACFAVLFSAVVTGRSWPLTAFLLGLSFAHHLMTVYLLPALAWSAYRGFRPDCRKTANSYSPQVRKSVLAACLFVLAVSPKLLFPPVRASQDPPLMLDRAASLKDHARYLAAGTYSSRIRPPVGMTGWRETAATLAGQASAAGCAAGILGLVLWSRAAAGGAPGAALAPWLTGATGLAFASGLAITGREYYLMPVLWILAMGTGLLAACGFRAGRIISLSRLGAAALLVPALLAFRNRGLAGRDRAWIEYDYGRDLLSGLPARTVFFMSGDDVIYPVFYLQLVEGMRGDVVAIPRGFLTYSPMRERIGKAAPELTDVLARPAGSRTEEEWSNVSARALAASGRPCAMTNPSRETISTGLRREVRDLVFTVFRNDPGPAAGGGWPRARGWYHPSDVLTDRGRWLIALQGIYQRQYADLLADSGRPDGSLPRFRRAISNPYLSDPDGAANNYALALERTGDRAGALAVYDRLAAAGSRLPEAYINAGNLLLGLGRGEEARTRYGKALELSVPGSSSWEYARRKTAGKPGK